MRKKNTSEKECDADAPLLSLVRVHNAEEIAVEDSCNSNKQRKQREMADCHVPIEMVMTMMIMIQSLPSFIKLLVVIHTQFYGF